LGGEGLDSFPTTALKEDEEEEEEEEEEVVEEEEEVVEEEEEEEEGWEGARRHEMRVASHLYARRTRVP
tara:strand:- start:702 stop:908 length:207 start_codon:yes stop_codon:yes gene_type:complete